MLRSLEGAGLLEAGHLTAADVVVTRALLWAHGARGGDPERERELAVTVRELVNSSPAPEAQVVVLRDRVAVAHDQVEALVVARGSTGAVALLPVGAWVAEVVKGQ